MTTLSAQELHDLARRALLGRGFPPAQVDDVVREFVTAELLGQPSHGLGKLASLQLGTLDATPEFTRHGAVLTVNGAGGNGFLLLRTVAARLADEIDGVAVAAVHNFSRYGALYPYPELLAGRGLVGILMNTAGPAAVVPFGSFDPITGTNPICFSFPTPDGPQTLDLSTAERVWGEIRHATLSGEPLPAGPFLDDEGRVTTTPATVNAVTAFGGAKGWALNLAIEVLAGALVGARAGLTVRDEFDCGALLIAIDPAATGAGTTLPTAVGALLDEVRQARPLPDTGPVRAPGDRRRAAELPTGVEVAPATLELLERSASGADMSDLSANPLLN